MEAIEKLKKIGVKEINKTTKISVAKIEDILEKRFSNIQRVRAVGFLKILENEYRVDLSEWLKEYDESFLSDMTTPDVSDRIDNSVRNFDFDTQKRTDDLFEERKKQLISKKRFYISLVVVLLILGGYFAYKNLISDPQSFPEESLNAAEIIPEGSSQNPNLEKSSENQAAFTQDSSNEDIDKSIETPQESQSLEAQESQSMLPQSLPSNNQVNNSDGLEAKEITVVPNHNLWIEVIDLNTQEKTETITQSAYVIKAKNHDLLISFGHGDFSLQTNKGVENFNKSYPMRFLYTPKDGMKRIKYSKYLELSGKEQ